MRVWLLWGLLLGSAEVLAQACVVETQGAGVQVKVCQQNRSIPATMFREGFCAPQLKGQQVTVSFVEQCPIGAFGLCRDAQVAGTLYRQDVHYYGVASDARLLKPACERQYRGVWTAY